MNDIKSKDDIIDFVNRFYDKVKEDNLLGPIFLNRIENESWSKHLSKMYSFWNTVLFGQADYRGNPFSHHVTLNIEKAHFDKWICLFEETIYTSFKGPKATEAILRANKMRRLFESKLDYINSNPEVKPIL